MLFVLHSYALCILHAYNDRNIDSSKKRQGRCVVYLTYFGEPSISVKYLGASWKMFNKLFRLQALDVTISFCGLHIAAAIILLTSLASSNTFTMSESFTKWMASSDMRCYYNLARRKQQLRFHSNRMLTITFTQTHKSFTNNGIKSTKLS